MKYILLVLASFFSAGAYAQGCGNTLTMPDTLSLCIGSTSLIGASMTGTDATTNIAWTPPTDLSSTIIINPSITAVTSGYRWLTVRTLVNTNLVVNGDFSAGNTGFGSVYTYSPPPSAILLEGFYSVFTNPNSVHTGFAAMGDHTTGTGNMMIINGAASPDDVWCQTITVTPNTDYDFSAWFANCSSILTGAPVLQFKINGVLIGTPTTITAPIGTWTNFATTWNSGAATSATICINDNVTVAGGNDFVIDDISFKQICVYRDSVYIDVNLPDTTTSSTDTTICASAFPHTLTAPSGYTTYTWSTGATATTTMNAASAGTYWVNSELTCVLQSDTFHVASQPNPVVLLGNDTSFCEGNTYILSNVQPTGYTQVWSTGSTNDTIHISTTGTYSVTVTDTLGCTNGDAIVVTVSPSPIVDLGPDILNCNGTPAVLQSSVTYPPAATYLWSDLSTATTLTVTTSGTYWLQVSLAGCIITDTINVIIKYDTFTLYTNDTAICRGQSVQVYASNNVEMTYQWLPTAGIAVSTISSPMVTPGTSAWYVVTAVMDGCPPKKDSFYLDVQPNPDVYISNTRHVCQFDTLHLHAHVQPAWYTHYIYSWTPPSPIDFPNNSSVIYTATGSTGNVAVTVTTPAGCLGADSVTIVVHELGFTEGPGDTSLCPGDSVLLSASGAPAYKWTPATYLSSDTASNVWVKPINSQNYSLVSTNEYNCHDTFNINITVRPAAVVHMEDSVSVFPGESYHIQPQTNGTTFIWTPAGGLNSRYVSNPITTPAISTKYIVYATTEHGCKTKDSIYVNIDENVDILVPNAFAPGSFNGKFYPRKKGIVYLKNFRIYNRWGILIYESADIESGWDGTYKGAPQPEGVYIYTIEAVSNMGKQISKTGNVTLLR